MPRPTRQQPRTAAAAVALVQEGSAPCGVALNATVRTARQWKARYPGVTFRWAAPQINGGKTRVHITAPAAR